MRIRDTLREAILHGREPPPAEGIARRESYRWIVVGCVCIGAFMGQLDASIAQLMLPRLEKVFDVRLSTVSWVPIAFLLAMAGFLPIFGRLADLVGRKLIYVAGAVLFVAGSLVSGFAPNLEILIAGRVVQGISAAMMSANSVAILIVAAGPEQRGRAIGILAAAQAAGLSLGPAIGGFLVDSFDWRWVFFLFVPIAALAGLFGWFVIPTTKIARPGGRFDRTGALLLVPALAALLVAVNQAHAWGLLSPWILASAAASLVLFGLFFRTQMRRAEPLIDLDLLRSPGFASGNLGAMLSFAMLFGVFFLMPFVLIRAYGDSAFEAGLRLILVPVALSLIAPVSGALYDRIGARALKVSGMVIAALALVVLHVAMDGEAASLPVVMAALAVIGLGQGLFTAPNNSAIMAAAPAHLTGEAGSLVNVSRTLGTSLGVALTASVLSWRVTLLSGEAGRTVGVAPDKIATAASQTVLLLVAFAALAALVSLVGRGAGRAKAS